METIQRSASEVNRKPRARDLGLPFSGTTGPANAITDVAGVEVGYSTVISDATPLGRGPARTGVTAILPRGSTGPVRAPVWAGFHSLNGNGEMTGTHWIKEAGYFTGPIGITNTHSLGVVHQSILQWMNKRPDTGVGPYQFILPIVGETCDAYLNDMDAFYISSAHVVEALDGASSGPLAEGNVGGGTGMICFEFKGGTGTSSRVVDLLGYRYTLGCLVQANFGIRPLLKVLGVPVGEHIRSNRLWAGEQGSIIAVVATDAPLMPTQLERVARRAGVGIGRTGTPVGDGSGDLCLAFSTSNLSTSESATAPAVGNLAFLPNNKLDPLFEAAAQAVEEAIINAMVAAESMVGREDRFVAAIDHDALRKLMRTYGRLNG
ncbi:MAG: S58 family peptidase [Mesorhizobium sp.]|uniref:DmpA family aminopeptidase n=1 Tax=Mesorhizobium sp. TaxID=1871066 RepID=UPI000FE9D0A9|nr:P1 family peptidase [Mesorhizobium sp.]RWD50793.1 MAG: S58 family peptidase [Mesorhizobium sp.]RWE58690.1 MAG: S58 family peptidase [Mesorhizobium sp.]RWF22350.1 MAG: S58 family peptidase [Mesorhizobium sp.]